METRTEKRTTTTTTTSSSSNTTHARACAYAREASEDHARQVELNVQVEDLRSLYAQAIGAPMSPMIAKELRHELEAGTPYIYYHYALWQTAYAPRPSWRYTLAIVRRLKCQEVPEKDLEIILSL